MEWVEWEIVRSAQASGSGFPDRRWFANSEEAKWLTKTWRGLLLERSDALRGNGSRLKQAIFTSKWASRLELTLRARR